MRRRAVTLAAGLAVSIMAAGAGWASETVGCTAADGSDASVEMNIGVGLPADTPNWVRVAANGAQWSTLAMDGVTPVSLLQSFDDGRMFAVDLTDADVSEIVLSFRILRVTEGEATLRVGYLHVLGKSLHPVICDFGDSG